MTNATLTIDQALQQAIAHHRAGQLKEAVRVGDEQIDRGEGIIYSQERLDVISEKALTNVRNGKQTR